MLENLFDNTWNSINEKFRLTQTSTNKGLDFVLGDKDFYFILYFMLVLLPMEQGGVFQKNSRKRNLIQSYGSGSGKVVFARLKEIVILYIGITPINI